MIIDCDHCVAQPSACGDCVVGVLLSGRAAETAESAASGVAEAPPGAPTLSLDAPERRALDALAEHGLVPRLRLVAARTHRVHDVPTQEGVDRDAG